MEAAKANGKDAQSCHNAANKKINKADRKTTTNSIKCFEKTRTDIRDNLDVIIGNLVSAGRDLMTELDNIFPDCYAKVKWIWDAIKLRICIVKKLGMSYIKIRNLKKDATFAITTANHTSETAVEQGTECMSKVYTAAHSKIDAAKKSAFKCINNLQMHREEN
ncbi:uncharacterized protein LOC109860371 isoform X2 [Pseudomyrmex gracilis]|uniref:uncharacterized protein LOC109860371 isoform X2 n=1 Tax=Pseudomyrmex gracilis TaxID=219809 RepID=UPI0009951312|nr:uncharacterized protein LOC109860371 isoform X2 [Pseudomyrmex gracilis]